MIRIPTVIRRRHERELRAIRCAWPRSAERDRSRRASGILGIATQARPGMTAARGRHGPARITAGRNPPKDIHVVIEIPLGGVPVKYEIDKTSGALFVDRFLHTAMFYPGNYGFIPHTLSADGDPCDVLVISQVPVVPGAVIRCRPVGALLMEDEAGGDEKIIAVPVDALHPFYCRRPQLPRPAADHVRADRALLPALQGSGKGQVGHHRALARRRRRRAAGARGDRAGGVRRGQAICRTSQSPANRPAIESTTEPMT